MAPPAVRRLLSGASMPSEMSLETNVLRYLANCLERSRRGPAEGVVEMASPTQNEEAHMGYDSQVKLPDGRYVLLQFKRPLPDRTSISFKRPLPDRTSISFKVPSGQVSALLGHCKRSSFFVLPAVGTNDAMWGARAALLGCTLVVDAWDLYAPFAASMNDPYWIYRPKPATKTVRILEGAAGRAAYVSQGRGRKEFERIPSVPISCLCGAGRYGFAVRGGAVLACYGRTALDRIKYQEAVEARRREYWDLYPREVRGGPHARGPRAPFWPGGEDFVWRPGMDVLRTAGGGSSGRHAIRFDDE